MIYVISQFRRKFMARSCVNKKDRNTRDVFQIQSNAVKREAIKFGAKRNAKEIKFIYN